MEVDKLEKENQQLKREGGNISSNSNLDSELRKFQAENTALKNSIKSEIALLRQHGLECAALNL